MPSSGQVSSGPPRIPWVGQLFQFRRDPVGFLTRLARTYGDLVPFTLGSQPVLLLNHPEYFNQVLVVDHRNFVKAPGMERSKGLLGEGLLTSEGDFHLRQRRLAQPAFHRQRLPVYGAAMTEYGLRMRDQWQDGHTVDIAQEMMRLTLSVVAKTLLGADIASEADEIGEALSASVKHFFTIRLPYVSLLKKFFPPLFSSRGQSFVQARDRLEATVFRIIAEHGASGEDHGDLLSMLMLARDTEGDGGSMTERQLRDEVMTMLLVGHETTATALTWAWYLVSQHPDVEAAWHAELERVLQGRPPTADDVPQLPYTEMLFAETMRLYPPVWLIGRRALKSYTMNSVTVPRNGLILMSPYVIHHDARYFKDPDVFDPTRWTPEAKTATPKLAYCPFGAGPRQCVGEGFAWMEGVLLLATIAQRWRMRLMPGHQVRLQPLVTLRAKGGMPMVLEERKSASSS